ncbi:S26 family signal peptidase, partial [Streptomyces caeni]
MRRRRAISRLRDAAWVPASVGLALLAGTVVHTLANYRMATVMGDSMRPTYRQGDQLFIERIDASGIRRGDVLLIDAPEHSQRAVCDVVPRLLSLERVA